MARREAKKGERGQADKPQEDTAVLEKIKLAGSGNQVVLSLNPPVMDAVIWVI